MIDFVLDAYVIFWKHFDRLKSKDQDSLARATCALCFLVIILNALQIIGFIGGIKRTHSFASSEAGQLVIVGGALAIGSWAMRALINRHLV